MPVSQHKADGIAWMEQGQGPTVLFLHGMPGSCQSWAPQFAALAHHYRVIAWDMPGYGNSDLRPDLDTPALLAGCVAAFLTDQLGVKRAHVAGLSLGGMIGLELAISHPDLLASLILLNSSPKFGLDGDSDAADFVQSVQDLFDGGTSVRDLCKSILLDLMAPDCPEAILAEALDAMARVSKKGLVQAAAVIGKHDVMARMSTITTPTLVIAGALDTATPSAYSRMIEQAVSGARFTEIPNAGHLSNLENPESVNKAIASFLERNPKSGNRFGG